MFKIAEQLKSKNIAEYLIYMWQIEDLIRAHKLSIDAIESSLIETNTLSEEEREKEVVWFSDLIDMMRMEGVTEKGHLQINKNVIINLSDLHAELMKSSKYPFYSGAYYKALPFIVELRSKSANQVHSEIETCFDALYGIMLLRLQKKEISSDTQKAVESIASFISMLANYYEKNQTGELKFD